MVVEPITSPEGPVMSDTVPRAAAETAAAPDNRDDVKAALKERVRAFSKQANAGIKVKWSGVGEQATFFLAPNLRAVRAEFIMVQFLVSCYHAISPRYSCRR